MFDRQRFQFITSCHLCPFSGVVLLYGPAPAPRSIYPPLHSTPVSFYRRLSCALYSLHTLTARIRLERISSCLKLLKTAYRIMSGVRRCRSMAKQSPCAHLLPHYSASTPVYHSGAVLQQRALFHAEAVLVSRSRQGLSQSSMHSHHPKITRQWYVSCDDDAPRSRVACESINRRQSIMD